MNNIEPGVNQNLNKLSGKNIPEIKKIFSEPINLLNKGDINCIENKCMSINMIYKELSKIANRDNIKFKTDDDLVNVLSIKYNCKYKTLMCLLYKINNNFNDFTKYNINIDIIKNAIDLGKPIGPFDSKQWFSNVNIDDVLKKFEYMFREKKYLHIYFHMRDFKLKNIDPDEKKNLNKINFAEKYKEGYRCFSVVFNTDVSSGSGEHWFCLFGNFTEIPFTVEYFNSTGGSPREEIQDLMCRIKHEMTKYFIDNDINDNKKLNLTDYNDENNKDVEINCSDYNNSNNTNVKCIHVTKLVNQNDNYSCGAYSVYYILARLTGIPYKLFKNNIIGDELMHKFRYNLFAHNY